jgi:hypothetical protein
MLQILTVLFGCVESICAAILDVMPKDGTTLNYIEVATGTMCSRAAPHVDESVDICRCYA